MSFPVVMVHGMCCTGDVWHNFRSFFESRGAHVSTPTLRPDVRVRSAAPKALKQVRLASYLEQLTAEIAEVQRRTGETPALIGHSMGGLLAQQLAERNLVRAAVFISPTAPVGARDAKTRFFWSTIRLFGALGMTPGVIRPGPRVTHGVVLNMADDKAADRARQGFVAESGRAFRDFATARIDETRIKIPVLTVAARRDRMVPARLTRLTAKKYAAIGGDFIEYPTHGHWLYDEPGWEKPAGDIFEWLHAKASLPAGQRPFSSHGSGEATRPAHGAAPAR